MLLIACPRPLTIIPIVGINNIPAINTPTNITPIIFNKRKTKDLTSMLSANIL